MCTLGESIYYDGFEAGDKNGKAEGKMQTMLECIRNLMDSMKLSALEAMKQLKVPEEEQSMYEELLKKQ